MPPNATASVPSRPKLREFSVKHRILRLAKLPRRPGRPIEILAEFEPRTRIGLFELVAAEQELSELLHRKVLIVTPGVFRNGARKDTLREAIELYPAAG
jgi:hypothetical protein